MTDLVLVRSFGEAARAAAAVDAGLIAHDAVLLVARTGPVPEVATRLQASAAFAPIRARFSTIADLNDILEPYHPLAPTISDARLAKRLSEALGGLHVGRVVADATVIGAGARPVPLPEADPASIVAEALAPHRLGPAPDAIVLGAAPGDHADASEVHAGLVRAALELGPRIVLAPHPDAPPASHLAAERVAAEAGATLEVLDEAVPIELALAAWPDVPQFSGGTGMGTAAPAPTRPRRRGAVARRLDTARSLVRAYTFRP
ncbi:hypothetical protein [Demequina sp.]|uniref:hypothetical protein n=1 Tax=Demequina sp. TaxID=2050685 RepID=UPI0025DC9E23|nr:hypothetical protein [Demequina sp.]